MVDALKKQNLDVQIQEEFLSEARELLEVTQSSLMMLEKSPNDKEIISKIFRLAHTLKGGGAMSGFTDLAAFNHSLETLLSQLRDGALQVTPPVVGVLLQSNDVLKQWIDGLTDDRGFTLDTSETTYKIRALLTPDSVPPVVQVQVARKEPLSDVQVRSAVKDPNQRPLVPERQVVLVCEDEPMMVEMIEATFATTDVEMVQARNGYEGLEILGRRKVDLIITDLKMPVLDGLGLIERVRRVNKSLPIILISGFATRDDTISFIRSGIYDFIEKPFQMHDLLDSASRALALKRDRDMLQQIGVLNFRCYMSVLQLMDSVRVSMTSKSDQQVIETIEATMANIQKFTSHILRSKVS